MRQERTDAPREALEKDVLLATRGLSVGYGVRAIVEGVDLSLRAGQILTLVGPNGAGKSTILRTLCGQQQALAGTISLCGFDLRSLSVKERARLLAVHLTERVRPELLSCTEVVEMGRAPYTGLMGATTSADREKVRDAMELMQVWELRDRDFLQLSDGQRQRVLLARAICQEPRVLVLDEPMSHLDVRYQVELIRVLRQLSHERGMGIIMALHELPLARRASDWIVCVKEGAVALQGTPEQVFVPETIDGLFDLEAGTYDAWTGDVRAFGRGTDLDAASTEQSEVR